jgi:hypothetical protein
LLALQIGNAFCAQNFRPDSPTGNTSVRFRRSTKRADTELNEADKSEKADKSKKADKPEKVDKADPEVKLLLDKA